MHGIICSAPLAKKSSLVPQRNYTWQPYENEFPEITTPPNKPLIQNTKSVNPSVFQLFDYQILNFVKFEKWKLCVNPVSP